MSQSRVTAALPGSVRNTWTAGLAGGLVGGVGMGIVLHAGANLMSFVGALYGWPTVVGGWAVHLLNSVLAGLLFAFLVSRPVLQQQTTTVAESVAAGLVYAAAVGLLSAGLLLPLSMTALGVQSLPEPLVPLPGMLGSLLVVVSVGVAHVVYGVLLGATYAVVQARPLTATVADIIE
ncbi:hypothetical protein [Haloarcula marina]|uniref:hypothetical protein n=1 Tax=Haloarcula marina TaxID=2961574 RepID=UPI0020B732CE|nr:hypothetical protein [Halomicroarcula marina]